MWKFNFYLQTTRSYVIKVMYTVLLLFYR
jgi:hypothetical protein